MRIREKGFTLIELLVVITIITILSTVGLSVFSGVQKNSRDARRRADIDAIAAAMETHYGQFNPGYDGLCQKDATPTYDCSSGGWFAKRELPTDPQSANGASYCAVLTGTSCDNNSGDTYKLGSGGNPPAYAPTWTICATLEAGGTYCIKNRQ